MCAIVSSMVSPAYIFPYNRKLSEIGRNRIEIDFEQTGEEKDQAHEQFHEAFVLAFRAKDFVNYRQHRCD